METWAVGGPPWSQGRKWGAASGPQATGILWGAHPVPMVWGLWHQIAHQGSVGRALSGCLQGPSHLVQVGADPGVVCAPKLSSTT